MVKLRLTRTGHKNHATYRVVAADSHSKRDSRAIEYLGYYLPHEKKIEINEERTKHWLSIGAQPSSTVQSLLVRAGILDKKVLIAKKYSQKPGKKSQERLEAKAQKAEAKLTAQATEESTENDSTEEVSTTEEAPITESVTEDSTTVEEDKVEGESE